MWQRQDLVGSAVTWQRPTLTAVQPPTPPAPPRSPLRMGRWRLVAGLVLLAAWWAAALASIAPSRQRRRRAPATP